METKRFKKKQPNVDQSKKLTDRTWDQAKSLPAIVFKTPPPKIPQTWKQKD